MGLGATLAITAGVIIPRQSSVAIPLPIGEERPIRVLFTGDLMLDRNVARSAREVGAEGLFASSTLALFADADLRVGNLEGTITNNPSVAERDNAILRFTFAPALAKEVLQLLNYSAVSLANNHALDFGEFGYDDTITALDGAGVAHFGHPYNDQGTLSTVITAQGKTFCLVGYHSLFSGDTSGVLAEIARIKPDCYRVAVFAHWGEEYQGVQNNLQTARAHAFIDAGADVVIGAHPHVVQPVEVYQGKAIFYSLGNFMFDQNFSWATTHSLAVRADFYKDKTVFVLTPLSISQQYSSVAAERDAARVIEAAGGVAEFALP